MPGGNSMHIHSYQIHNVLNLYRQQLRKHSRPIEKRQPADQTDETAPQAYGDGQRQVIIDTISAEIMDRISRYGPQSEFNKELSKHLRHTEAKNPQEQQKTGEFTYTLIDEHNRKRTHSMRLQEFSPLIAGTKKGGLEVGQGAVNIEEKD
jgi:hypothetical protein